MSREKVQYEGNVKVRESATGYQIYAGKEGGRLMLPLTKGYIDGNKMTQDQYIVLPLYYRGHHSYYFNFLLRDEAGDFVQADFSTIPNMEVKVSFPLSFLNLETVFMKRTVGRLKNMMHGTPIYVENVVALELVIPPSSTECEIHFGYPYLADEEPVPNKNEKPQVDAIGQWTIKEWEGKTKSVEELVTYLQGLESEQLPEFKCERSKFGGELSMQREGTGYFRIHKEDGRYWFCDPEGYLLFSHGMDLIQPHEFCPVDGIEMLFEVLPPKEGIYKDAWKVIDGTQYVSFHTANLMRALGENWHQKWEELTKKRLQSFGFNTIANWAETGFGKRNKIPYVMQGAFPSTEKTLFRSMPDVFSKEYRDSARMCAQWLEAYKDDPYMIGYFMRNEPDWAFGQYNIAEIMLEKEVDFVTKDILIADMVRQYRDIEALNKAWNTSFLSFESLKKPILGLAKYSEKAKIDLENFTRRIIREYVRVPAEAYRAVDTKHLNLGLRYGWLASDDLVEGCEYCDVFSMNYYKEYLDKKEMDRIHAMTNLPILIGEFQVGSLDVGLMSNSMLGVESQEERGVFYQYYMEKAAELPYMIGAHGFQWNDQPTLGRFDGENLNIGIVDVCQKPYEEYVKGIRAAHSRVSAIHAGKTQATTKRSKIVPREGF